MSYVTQGVRSRRSSEWGAVWSFVLPVRQGDLGVDEEEDAGNREELGALCDTKHE